MIETFDRVWNEILSGSLFSDNDKAQVFFLHGWWWWKRNRWYMQKKLYREWISSFSLDFSGHWKSTGVLKHWSLEKRVFEANELIKKYSDWAKIVVCWSSMWCHIAVKLIEESSVSIWWITLIAPAIYSADAYRLRFDSWFTEEIRRENSYLQNDTMKLFQKYGWGLRVILWKEDQVIPSWVIQLLKKSTDHLKKRKIISFENCPHKIHGWLQDNDEYADTVMHEIISLVK